MKNDKILLGSSIVFLVVLSTILLFSFYYTDIHCEENYCMTKTLNFEEREKIKKTLKILNDKIDLLLDYLKNNYSDNENVKTMLQRYNKDNIVENSVDFNTYTINKGQKIFLCMLNKKTRKLEDNNTLIYVLLHELAHIGCITYSIESHNEEFKVFFKFLVEKAIEVGVYNYVDYSNFPVNYCNMTLNSNII